jgi:hypothetical protein
MNTSDTNFEPVPAHDGSVYPAQDSESLGEHYIRHICAMTSECLHSKAAIARQLAARDKMLVVLWGEYEDRKAQWGDEYLWEKHEDAEAIAEVKAWIAQTQNAERSNRQE